MKSVAATIVVLAASCASTDRATPPPIAPKPEAPVAPVAQLAPPPAKPAQPVAPDTPAGKTLQAWLDAFNSADETRIQKFVADYKFKQPASALLAFRNATGGFDLVAIEKSEPLELKFLVKEKASPTTAVGVLKLKGATEIDTLRLLAIPPGMTAADMDPPIDAPTRARVIDSAAAKLTELYVYPAVAKKMVQALRDHQKAGAYDAITQSRAFADLLTEQLRAVSHDRHLGVQFSPRALPATETEPTDAEKAERREHLEKINCGFQKAERLDGNVGYIKFDMFGDAQICGPNATAAFASLGSVDALIFDLRDNGGGDPQMVAFVSSYLFAKKTHLSDIHDRKKNKTTQYWTKPSVPGTKFLKQPVYVLTSADTFSAAEEFSYNLKNLKRGTIIGETTGGGAHPTMGQRLDDHFSINVPFARSINPITKTNWEGKGVEPDVRVPADQALDTAKKLFAELPTKRNK